ncbi:MAG TPA: hypothetical protein VFV75_12950 [Candidatus Polarisedimenticolaceae bacterium]|nr:hypothetical protein [Candidatus Polarisedimenticolaceae bacterium]
MNSRRLLIAALASALAAPGLVLAGDAPAQGKEGAIHCYGVNKCKGVGDCGGKGHSCAGENACKGQGYLEMSRDLCLKIEGGRLTENPQPVKSAEERTKSKAS